VKKTPEMKEIRFQLMSDLHLETPNLCPTYTNFKLEALCPNLVLLGDIGEVRDKELFDFLEIQLV
jgi:hypothetical protein